MNIGILTLFHENYNWGGVLQGYALKTLIEYLVEAYGKDKLCFILPLPRMDQENIYGDGQNRKGGVVAPLSRYIEIEIELFEKFGVKYVDFSDSFPVPACNTGDEFTIDGLHPNSKGHRLIAERLYTELKKPF